MKRILMQFLTETGVQAYNAVEEEGKKQSWKDRKISQKVCTDKVISKDPLTIQIDVKIGWLAVQVELDKQIVQGLEKFGAVQDQDFTMEVS